MLSRLVLLAAVLAATPAFAQRIYNLPAGQYLITGEVRTIGPVITPDGPDVPTPPIVPDQLTDRSKAIKAAAEAATSDPYRDQTAQQLASLYREIAKKVREGAIKDASVVSFAVKYGVDQLLTGKGSSVNDAWKATRAVYDSQMKAAIQNGDNDTKLAALLDEVAVGLDASAPNAPAEFDIAMIIKIIQMIMEILKLIPFNALATIG
jgi:hypothetical protein